MRSIGLIKCGIAAELKKGKRPLIDDKSMRFYHLSGVRVFMS